MPIIRLRSRFQFSGTRSSLANQLWSYKGSMSWIDAATGIKRRGRTNAAAVKPPAIARRISPARSRVCHQASASWPHKSAAGIKNISRVQRPITQTVVATSHRLTSIARHQPIMNTWVTPSIELLKYKLFFKWPMESATTAIAVRPPAKLAPTRMAR